MKYKEYKEYKASEGKVIFNIENFSYGIIILTKDDADIIELAEADAAEIVDKLEKEKLRIKEEEYFEHVEDVTEDIAEEVIEEPILKATNLKSVPLQATIVEELPLDKAKRSLLEELASKGYDLDNKVEPIIHE